jgi:hypothetical protein
MLDNLPLNTDQCYVMAKTKEGCEVYAPITKDCDSQKKILELQQEINKEIP